MARQATGAIFESGVTRRATSFAVVPGLVALLLIWNGLYYVDKFPGSQHMGWLLGFAILPLLFGFAIVVTGAVVFKKNMGRKVTISPDGFGYSHGGASFLLRWPLTAYSLPKGGKLYRVLVITDGKNAARIDDLFFPSFDEIVEGVVNAKGSRR